MKNIYTLILLILLVSCTEPEYIHIGQEIIDGRVSAIQKGKRANIGFKIPKIWIQTATTTKEIQIPFDYENRWNVGDSCLLIVEKYKENEDK